MFLLNIYLTKNRECELLHQLSWLAVTPEHHQEYAGTPEPAPSQSRHSRDQSAQLKQKYFPLSVSMSHHVLSCGLFKYFVSIFFSEQMKCNGLW